MSSSKSALAEHILYEHFGTAVGLVGSIFLSRGRLSYETLLRLAPKSLRQVTIQASILVLVQHNCLYHVLDDQDGLEYYELNLAEILERRRFGQFFALAKEHWEHEGRKVVCKVLSEGKIKLATLLDDCLAAPSSSSSHSYQLTVKVVYDLLEAGVLRKVTIDDQTSKEDQDLQYGRELFRKIKGPPQPKDLKKIKESVFERRALLDDEYPEWGQDFGAYRAICDELEDAGYRRGKDHEDRGETRSPQSSPRSKKRKALPNGTSSSKARRISLPFDAELYVRVVYGAFDVRLRNELIVKAVRVHHGPAPARLVGAILSSSIQTQKTLEEDRSDFVVAGKLVEPAGRRSPTRKPIPLPSDSPTTNGYHETEDTHSFYTLFPSDPVPATLGLEPSGQWSAATKEPIELVTEGLHLLYNTADSRTKAQLLKDPKEQGYDRNDHKPPSWLVVEGPEPKLTLPPASMKAVGWAVDFASSYELLKVGLLENYIKGKLGKAAFRIWRVVDEKGKMEEKQIAKVAMLTSKQIRETIARLSSAGFLHQQEVPRTMDRNPSRTFFLWYVSRTLCYQVLLSHLYNALVNIHVRQKEEKLRHRALLRRSERRDVRENRALLDEGDRQDLGDLDWRLQSLGVAQERIDSDLLVLETLPVLL